MSSSIRNLLPRSFSSKRKSTSNPKFPNSDAENTPPTDPNIIQDDHHQSLPLTVKQSHSKTLISSQSKPTLELDPSVKVVVRIRPTSDNGVIGDRTVKKVSSDTLSVGDRQFNFDSVFDSNTSQEDIFQSVGVPLVRDALAGYNTSILSYGQSGSGKTYTMWGPPSAMFEEPSAHSHKGIVPRLFQMLFSELEKEQRMSEGKQFNYQCRCCFLEIYNEQVGDLLDPTQRNLEMKDDSKNALYIENLTEEYVTSYDDVTQILIKGLSSRKVGATTLNSKSSRSHIIFTLVIESWCKGTSINGFSSSKSSRISLIDLAGQDKNKVDGAGRQCLKESKNVKKSLSQLGHLVDALTKENCLGKAEIPNRNSCLTRLLSESLGGNAKLSVICSITPDNKNNGETLCTLRFGQRVRSIRNEPVINEIKEDDVNDLSDKIRLLKEELIRAKADVHSSDGNKNGYFHVQNVRESLNQLRVSLNRSLLLPNIDNDSDEEANVDEEDIRELRQQIDEFYSSCDGNLKDISVSEDCAQYYSIEENCDADNTCGDDEIEKGEVCSGETLSKLSHEDSEASANTLYASANTLYASANTLYASANTSRAIRSSFTDSISVSSSYQSPMLEEPQQSESPKIRNIQRKSVAFSSSCLGSSKKVAEENSSSTKGLLGQSCTKDELMRSSLRLSKVFPGPTESLAESLKRGLQIIDCHQRNSSLNKSSTSFSFGRLSFADSCDPTMQQKKYSIDERTATMLCDSCHKKISDQDSSEVRGSLKSCIDTAKAGNLDGPTDKAPKDLESIMEKEITREEELENVCKEQAARIDELNQLVEKLKEEKELNSIIVYGQESSKQIELAEEDNNSVKDECKLLRSTSSDNSRLEEKCEIKEVREELTQRSVSFDVTEKEELLKEIQNLRSKLQLCSDAPVKMSTDKLRSSLISRSIQLRKSGVFSLANNGEEELEKERERWTEMESEWICLTDELRVDLEANRHRAERVEQELRLEKMCTEELDDALKRSVLGHARMVEHYADLQEKYNDLVAKHNAVMHGIAEVKKAAAKAGKRGHARFAKSLAAELSALRVEREREAKFLKKENTSLKMQLRDTAEAVHAAGELLVRLREAEHAASSAEDNFTKVQQDNEKLKKQMDKLKRKHKMEMITMKNYLAESKLPESALKPLYREDSDVVQHNATPYQEEDQAWRAEFGAIYQEHY